MEAYFVENLRTAYVFSEGQLNEVKINAVCLQYQDGVMSNHWFQCETNEGVTFVQKECYRTPEAYKKGQKVSLSPIYWRAVFKNKGTTFWYLGEDGDVRSKDISKGYVTVTLTPNEYGRFVNFQILDMPDSSNLYTCREDVFLYHDVQVKNLDGTIEIHENPFNKTKLTDEQQAKVKEMINLTQQFKDLGMEVMVDFDGYVFAVNTNNGAYFSSDENSEKFYLLDSDKFLVGKIGAMVTDSCDMGVILKKKSENNNQ